ncbi:mandelate racemase/muconate lactonizing enzyme family protein [Halocatena salina]|uniref:o-succinylbenzoate synthase n=1 Tax=Halocatena salina TaxID=2934340 RepID=A0A8U0A223_9EURY|nr:mandelate racemase/muconate lactonizing enzyme family protein [Halocatena salina]UPM42498.1 mandelate racemase/muconate lactonizing enzyme family protein [Halocatena salina]
MTCTVRFERFAVALSDPLTTASATITRREGFLVRIETETRCGIGEATPLDGWTESIEDCRAALERIEDGWTFETCPSSHAVDAAFGDVLRSAPAARHGLTLACLDLRAKRARQPLYRYLGGREHIDSVPVNATIGDGTVAETVTAAENAVDRGYSCLKCKVGARSVTEDVSRLRAVRSAVGPTVELRGDANGAWSRKQATTALEAFEDAGVSYVEQPLASTDIEGHAILRTETDIGVALDETVRTTSITRVLAARAADVLVIKPMVLGGVDRAHATARLARAVRADVTPVVTTTIDAAYARAGAIHVGAAIPNVAACGLATGELLDTDLACGPSVTRGQIAVPQTAGVGVRGETATGNSVGRSKATDA